MPSDSLSSLYWDTEKKVGGWLADLLPGTGIFLPFKLTAGGMASMADNAQAKTLTEKVSDYGAGVAHTALTLPSSSAGPEISQTVADLAEGTRESIGDGFSGLGDAVAKALTLPDWMKYTIIAGLMLATYQYTKRA
jgi:hypothetical protein